MAESLKGLLPGRAAHWWAAQLGVPEAAPLVRAARHIDDPALGLMARGQVLAEALLQVLPTTDGPAALKLLAQALGPVQALDARGEPLAAAVGAWTYLPVSQILQHHTLDHPDAALDLMEALTQRFTAEFCLRPYVVRHPDRVWPRLAQWVHHPSAHVRRLVSEGIRPRLPWASRLPPEALPPERVEPLLEALRDDPSSYVRRSVANHLGDWAKNTPDHALRVARDWWVDAPAQRQALLRHALRWPLKQGHPGALALFGQNHALGVRQMVWRIDPEPAAIGFSTRLHLSLVLEQPLEQPARLDLRVYPPGSDRPRVFRLADGVAGEGPVLERAKTLSFVPMSTRRHRAGTHHLELVLNGWALDRSELNVLPENLAP